jgi:hypothetical protein
MPLSLKKWPLHAEVLTKRIDDAFDKLGGLDINTQFLLGEILLIRTAQILEEILPEVFARLVCETQYIDGTAPTLLHKASGIADAFLLMQTFNRRRSSRRQLKWLDATYIQGNVQYLIDQNDHSLLKISAFSSDLNELRVVRNEAAHRTASTKAPYRTILQNYYSSGSKLVPVGKFVISDRFRPPHLTRYNVLVRTIVKELCKA